MELKNKIYKEKRNLAAKNKELKKRLGLVACI
eukprot:COSAG01_NODE_52_length_31456_cov_125.226648_35_plen_32_part_00